MNADATAGVVDLPGEVVIDVENEGRRHRARIDGEPLLLVFDALEPRDFSTKAKR